jgi:hypothetical protein
MIFYAYFMKFCRLSRELISHATEHEYFTCRMLSKRLVQNYDDLLFSFDSIFMLSSL